MKRVLIGSVVLFSMAAFAQAAKADDKAPAKAEEKAPAKAPEAAAPAAAPAAGASADGLSVSDAKLGTDVQNNEVVGEGASFKADESKVYLWTAISGGAEGKEVTHVWYRGQDKVSEVKLPVKYNPTKTWSYKTLHAGFPGDWRVDVVASDGTVLKSVPFKVE